MNHSPFSVVVDRDHLRFNASHWIKFAPCNAEISNEGTLQFSLNEKTVVEPLHGHTFRVRLEVNGPLDKYSCVIDFVLAERILKHLLERFEHKILIARRDPDMTLSEDDTQVHISVFDKKWSFPKVDVVYLPVTNATAEVVAKQILDEFVGVIQTNRLLPFPMAQYQFELTLEEETGFFAKICRTG